MIHNEDTEDLLNYLLAPLSEFCLHFCNFLISLQFFKVNKKIFTKFNEWLTPSSSPNSNKKIKGCGVRGGIYPHQSRNNHKILLTNDLFNFFV